VDGLFQVNWAQEPSMGKCRTEQCFSAVEVRSSRKNATTTMDDQRPPDIFFEIQQA
jgi:hypothetical protein